MRGDGDCLYHAASAACKMDYKPEWLRAMTHTVARLQSNNRMGTMTLTVREAAEDFDNGLWRSFRNPSDPAAYPASEMIVVLSIVIQRPICVLDARVAGHEVLIDVTSSDDVVAPSWTGGDNANVVVLCFKHSHYDVFLPADDSNAAPAFTVAPGEVLAKYWRADGDASELLGLYHVSEPPSPKHRLTVRHLVPCHECTFHLNVKHSPFTLHPNRNPCFVQRGDLASLLTPEDKPSAVSVRCFLNVFARQNEEEAPKTVCVIRVVFRALLLRAPC